MSWSGRTNEQPRERANSLSPRTVPGAVERTHAFENNPRSQYSGPSIEDTSQPASSRSLGIHGLINPANPPQTERRLADVQTSPFGGTASHLSTPTGTPRPYVFTGQPGAQPPTQPVTTPLAHTPSERGSPATSYPFPALNNPRQIASPLPGPPADLSRGPPERYGGPSGVPHPSPTIAPDGSLLRPLERGPDTSPSSQSVQGIQPLPFPGSRYPERPPGALVQNTRSMSQPLIPYPRFGSHMQQSTAPRQHQWSPQQGPLAPGQHTAPSPTAAPPHAAEEPVGTPLYRTLLSVAASGGFEGQTMLRMASGPGGEPLDIVLDTNNASRQMDEKRQRNATASHRHRYRKKEERQMLETEHRELKSRLSVVEHERDFYRAERARLMELLLRTPLADQAAGPPSPSASAAMSMPEGNPSDPGSLAAGISRPASAGPMTERPARRRRIKAPPGATMPSYTPVSSPAVTLPPISGSTYGSSAEPSPPLSAGARLPSLRAVEGFGRESPAQAAGGPPYQAYSRVPHETGWVHQMSENTGFSHTLPPGGPHPPNPYQDQNRTHGPR